MSERPGNEAENTIAVNPTDPRNVAAMTCATGRKNLDGLFLGVSFDGGKTWRRRLFATGAQIGHTCDERLAWDPYGNLWMSHLTAKGHVFVGVSDDGGLRFAKVTDIVPGGPKITRPTADQPFIATGPGSVWVSYADTPSGVIQAAGAKVSGRGRFGSFTPPQSIPTRHGHGDASGIAIGPHGQVLVIYENIASAPLAHLHRARPRRARAPQLRPPAAARPHPGQNSPSSSRPSRTGASTPSPSWSGTPDPVPTTAGCMRSGPKQGAGTGTT